VEINMGFFEDNFGENTNNESTHHRIKWEYKVVHNILLNTAYSFNALGNEGWEMCAYSDTTNTAVFKRVKY
jgi:hypothetical protein